MTTTQNSAANPADLGDTSAPHGLNRRWCDAFNAGDLDLLMTMYDPDAVLIPGPDAPAVRGHDAIRAALEQFLALGGTLRFTPRYWHEQGTTALSSIAFVMDGATDAQGNPFELHGTTAEVLHRHDDGTWTYLIDHPFSDN